MWTANFSPPNLSFSCALLGASTTAHFASKSFYINRAVSNFIYRIWDSGWFFFASWHNWKFLQLKDSLISKWNYLVVNSSKKIPHRATYIKWLCSAQPQKIMPQWSDTLKTFLHEIKLHHHQASHEIATPHFCTRLCWALCAQGRRKVLESGGAQVF